MNQRRTAEASRRRRNYRNRTNTDNNPEILTRMENNKTRQEGSSRAEKRKLNNTIRAYIFGKFIEEKIRYETRNTEAKYAKLSRGETETSITPSYDKEELRRYAKKNYHDARIEVIKQQEEDREKSKKQEEYRKITEGRKKISLTEYRKRHEKVNIL